MTTSKPPKPTKSSRRRARTRETPETLAPQEGGVILPGPEPAPDSHESRNPPVAQAEPAAATASPEPVDAAAAAPSEPSEPSPPSDEMLRVAGDLARLRALLATLQAQRDAIEGQHTAHAQRSPLALRLEVVGCRLAAVHWPDATGPRNIPTFTWLETRCPFAKTTPDQDCRDCAHHTVMPLGMEMEPHTRRYPHAGTIVPLTEEQATLLAQYLAALGAPALRRVDAEIDAVTRAIAGAEIAQRHAQQQALEAQQRGQRR